MSLRPLFDMADFSEYPGASADAQPNLFAALNEEIIGDLDHNYTHTATSFPSRPELETPDQREDCLVMIEEWIGVHVKYI